MSQPLRGLWLGMKRVLAPSSGRASFASGTVWSAVGIGVSSVTMLAANLLAVATSSPAAFGDLAVVTAALFLVGTTARLGANQLIIAEIHDAEHHAGELAGRQRGADLIAFVLVTGVLAGFALWIPPARHLVETALSSPLTNAEITALDIWLVAEVVRLVVSEAHRARYQFKLATAAGQARAPLFLILLGLLAAVHSGRMGRSDLLWASALASGVLCLVALGTAAPWFGWWHANPLRSARFLWRGHLSMLLATIAAALIGSADVWILGSTADVETRASYGLAVTLVAGIGVLGVAVASGLAPFLASASAQSSLHAIQGKVRSYVRGASALAFVALVLLVVVAGPIARTLGGGGYGRITVFVAILGGGQLAGVVAGVGGMVLIVARHYRANALVAVGVALTGVLLEGFAAWALHSPILVASASGLATAALHTVNAVVLFRVMRVRTDAFAPAYQQAAH